MQSLEPNAAEIARRGKAIYEREIRAKVEPENTGKYLVIDVYSGDYEIDADHFAASRRAYEKHPDGLRCAIRIGYRAIGRTGLFPGAKQS